MFLTNKAAQEKISTLESRIEELESDLTAKDEEISNLQNESKDNSENQVKIETLTNELTAKDEQITELNAKLIEAEAESKDADESASAKAVEMLATIGQEEPLEIQDSAVSEGVKTRAEFNAMKPSARMAFVKAGGKIK